MNTITEDLKSIRDSLKTKWDELRVQTHLAGMELKDDLQRWEADWQQFEQSAEQALHKLEEQSQPALDKLRETGQKLREELQALARRLKS